MSWWAPSCAASTASYSRCSCGWQPELLATPAVMSMLPSQRCREVPPLTAAQAAADTLRLPWRHPLRRLVMALMCSAGFPRAIALTSNDDNCAQADPPDASKLPQDDIVGVTVLLLTCSYKDRVRMCSLLLVAHAWGHVKSWRLLKLLLPVLRASSGVHPRGLLCEQ